MPSMPPGMRAGANRTEKQCASSQECAAKEEAFWVATQVLSTLGLRPLNLLRGSVDTCPNRSRGLRPVTGRLPTRAEACAVFIAGCGERGCGAALGERTWPSARPFANEPSALCERTLALRERTLALRERTSALRERTSTLRERTSVLRERISALRERTSALREPNARSLANLGQIVPPLGTNWQTFGGGGRNASPRTTEPASTDPLAGTASAQPAPGARTEREGFEPSMELMTPYSLSRRVPSATRPPLLGPRQCRAWLPRGRRVWTLPACRGSSPRSRRLAAARGYDQRSEGWQSGRMRWS